MNQLLFFVLISLLSACSPNASKSDVYLVEDIQDESRNDLKNDTVSDNYEMTKSIDAEFATYFIVVADTNTDYSLLLAKMISLNKHLNIEIDTMGRYYNKAKNLIALPDDDEDEIYAGDYFPRRYPTESLSLEYLNFYIEDSGDKTIALLTGIYEYQKLADSALSKVRTIEPSAFQKSATIYIGCMH